MTVADGVAERGVAEPIAADRAHSLFRWNAVLAGLHAIQGLVMVVITFARDPIVTAPIFGNYLTFDTAEQTLVPAQQMLFELPIGLAVATFFFLSAAAHALLAWPLRGWYEHRLASGIQPMRWVEYSLSSSVMIVVIAVLAGIQDAGALIALFGVNAAMILFGWSMESANQGRDKVQWNHFVFGSIAGIVPWLVIGLTLFLASTEPNAAEVPTFVYVIFVTLFLAFNVFAITMVLQYGRIGRWRDYLVGEKTYMVMSLLAKTLLAWLVFAGMLRP